MNVVFLDIDGVLNQCQPNCYIDKKCFDTLVRICKDTNSNIVLSSSWRVGFTLFGKCSPHIQKLVDMLAEHNISIIGRTPKRGDRGIEIKEYIRTHNISRYVILDDDKEEFKEVIPNNLYIVNHKTGLSAKDVVAIERILVERPSKNGVSFNKNYKILGMRCWLKVTLGMIISGVFVIVVEKAVMVEKMY